MNFPFGQSNGIVSDIPSQGINHKEKLSSEDASKEARNHGPQLLETPHNNMMNFNDSSGRSSKRKKKSVSFYGPISPVSGIHRYYPTTSDQWENDSRQLWWSVHELQKCRQNCRDLVGQIRQCANNEFKSTRVKALVESLGESGQDWEDWEDDRTSTWKKRQWIELLETIPSDARGLERHLIPMIGNLYSNHKSLILNVQAKVQTLPKVRDKRNEILSQVAVVSSRRCRRFALAIAERDALDTT